MITKNKKNKKSNLWKNTFLSVLIAVFSVSIIVFLVSTNVKVNKKRAQQLSRIDSIKKEIQILEEKNKELIKDVSWAGSQSHLEKVAREQLGMKIPGEEVVVVTKEENEPVLKNEPLTKKDSFWNFKKIWNWLMGNNE